MSQQYIFKEWMSARNVTAIYVPYMNVSTECHSNICLKNVSTECDSNICSTRECQHGMRQPYMFRIWMSARNVTVTYIQKNKCQRGMWQQYMFHTWMSARNVTAIYCPYMNVSRECNSNICSPWMWIRNVTAMYVPSVNVNTECASNVCSIYERQLRIW
jgi:hypothetical protein